MVDSNNKKRKEFITEDDIATLLQRYDTMTILKLLQEIAYYAEKKLDWNELVKKTNTGITNAREYQLLWRHLAYRGSLFPVGDDTRSPNDDSDMECELEAFPAVGVDAVAEAVAHVKVIAASYVPSGSDIPEDSTVEAPLTINIPYRGPQEVSDSYWQSKGMNITFPVLLQKAAEGHNGNGSTSGVAPRRKRKKWSAQEDEELIAFVKQHGDSWNIIATKEYEGEVSAQQLSQRWSNIKKKVCDISNPSTQSGLQRTEAQIAANRALSIAVGDRPPSKKLAAGIPPILSTSSIAGGQANGVNTSSSLQGQKQSQPVVQGLARATTPAPTAKPRVTGKKTTANSTSRAALQTANSVAAAACMSGIATGTSAAKSEPGKNTVTATVMPQSVPVKPSSSASLPIPSDIIPPRNVEPVKTAAPAASLPRPPGITPKPEPLKPTAGASLTRPSGIQPPTPNAEPVKPAAAASLPRPSKIPPAISFLPRPSIIPPNAEPRKPAPKASWPRLSGIISQPKAEPVKSVSTASMPRPSAPKADPVKNVPVAAAATTKTQAVGGLNVRQAVNVRPPHVMSPSPYNKPSPMMGPLSKGPTVQNNSAPSTFASSRLAPIQQKVPTVTVLPPKPNPAATVPCKPVVVQKEQTQANRTTPLVTATTPQPNKTNPAITTGKVVAAKVETPPKKNQVPPGKEGSTTVSPSETESKPKDEASKGVVTGTEKKGL